MAERSEPSMLHLLVDPEWFTTTIDTEAGNNQEDMEEFIDQLLVQAEIPELEAPPAETPAVTQRFILYVSVPLMTSLLCNINLIIM